MREEKRYTTHQSYRRFRSFQIHDVAVVSGSQLHDAVWNSRECVQALSLCNRSFVMPAFHHTHRLQRQLFLPEEGQAARVGTLSSRHLGCRCCTEFRQSSTGGVVINAVPPRHHCLKAQKEEEKTPHTHTTTTTTRRLGPKFDNCSVLTVSLLTCLHMLMGPAEPHDGGEKDACARGGDTRRRASG